jgi:DNA/RNA-binding domain of Phe-tRNA-synthetase-like protein
MFEVSEAWKQAYPGASVGVLALRGVANPPHHPALEDQKKALEEGLRARYAGLDRKTIEALPLMQAYAAYYKRFNKTYHVQLQLESIVFKGKPIPSVAALVEAMFMAEVKNLLLTAGHDLDALQLPLRLDVAGGTEQYMLLRGQEQQIKENDMMISDQSGIVSSILYGPDQRTPIRAETKNALFTVYAPPGIGPQSVQDHLEDILASVRVFTPQAGVEMNRVFVSGD